MMIRVLSSRACRLPFSDISRARSAHEPTVLRLTQHRLTLNRTHCKQLLSAETWSSLTTRLFHLNNWVGQKCVLALRSYTGYRRFASTKTISWWYFLIDPATTLSRYLKQTWWNKKISGLQQRAATGCKQIGNSNGANSSKWKTSSGWLLWSN